MVSGADAWDGSTITQLGHVDDLADAMVRALAVDAAANHLQLFVSQRDHLCWRGEGRCSGLRERS